MKNLKQKLLNSSEGKFNFHTDFRAALIPDPKDDRDIVLSAYKKPRRIPKVVDWYVEEMEIKNQGQTNTCVGQSCAYLKQIQEFFEHLYHYNFDGFDLYNECKKIDNYPADGTFLRIGLKILSKQGVKPEGINTSKRYKISSYARLDGLEAMKYAITSTGPIVIGIKVYENMERVEENGFVPEPKGAYYGGHAVVVTGYDDFKGGFRFLNSWGKEWGINGTAWLSYDYIEKHMIDAWSAIDEDDPIAETWLDLGAMKKDIEIMRKTDA